jgi:flagellar motor switch protein FliN/FliY
LRDWLSGEFARAFSEAIESMAGAPIAISGSVQSSFVTGGKLAWRQPFQGIAGAMYLAAAEADWKLASGWILKAAGIEDSDDETLRSTFFEVTNQALASVARAMSAKLGHEVTPHDGGQTAMASAAEWVVLDAANGADRSTIAIGFDRELLQVLVEALAPEPAEVQAASPSKTFGLLLDVELPVSVSFGRAQVPLKDVLKLTTGSIVELNRSINEPVEVIVNNCVIARGEVVVVEGNFGVRIQQVISREERLRTLN